MQTQINDGSLVLFQGDSITDAGRSRDDLGDLGNGYPALVSAWFSALFPQKRVRFLNRGVSGNRASDLRMRWDIDCLDIRPDWVSILIGINDTWRRYDSNDPTSSEEFRQNYRAILEATQKIGARILILEPFVLPVPEDRREWRVDLDPKIQVARDLAREFAAVYVALDGLFASASVQREPAFWLPDGVHPSVEGHALIAQAWLKAVQAIA
jgi:lysophospholipase L1-like esterase